MNVRRLPTLGGVCITLALACAAGAAAPAAPRALAIEPVDVASAFRAANPQAHFYRTGDRITTVYGKAFSAGTSPVASAEAFLNAYAAMWSVEPADLIPGSLAADNAHVRELMPDLQDGHMRFTLVSYLQTRDNIPVYRGNVRLLVRNEEGFPLVLARAGLFDLGGFAPDQGVAAEPNIQGAFNAAAKRFPGIGNFTPPEVVIWAGSQSAPAEPALAVVFEGSLGDKALETFEKWLVIADASTGAILHTESRIHHIDVTGSVKGMATQGFKSDNCDAEALAGMPYSRVSIGATVAYADVNGDFTIPNGGAGAVTVQSGIRGRYFQAHVGGSAGADPEVLSLNVTPPGPANFVHNSPNTNATHRSGVNAYLHSNIVRDYALHYMPTFPSIGNQTEPAGNVFEVNVNVSGTCNAFYDGTSINFYATGGGCPATSFSTVVYHEYGHHLVQMGGSGQGQYGEGMSDVMGVIIADSPILAIGWNLGDCVNGLRSAANTMQYPCSSGAHACAPLLSGCVWSVRNELVGPFPSTYRDVLGSLAVNSIPLHDGDLITPQITIDWLTLDDDNGNIGDGSPHYTQINNGFTAHNMDGPPLNFLDFTFPDGIPNAVDPAGGSQFRVQVVGLAGTPQENTGVLHVDPEGDGTFADFPMPQISPNLYDAVFPASTCGDTVAWYVTAKTTNNITVFDPADAPAGAYHALSAQGSSVAFFDDFQTDKGWTSIKSSPLSAVNWVRADPDGLAGRPTDDFNGGGNCYFTKNGTGPNTIGGTLTLLSPTLDATGDDYDISYARWFSNDTGNNPHTDSMVVEISNDNGASWVNLETVGPSGPQTSGGWFVKSTRVADVLPPTAQMKVRFILQDVGGISIIGAGVDDFRLQHVTCGCPADFNGDGFVDGIDYDMFNNAFEAGDPSADFNGDGFVDGIDYDQFNIAFEAGC